MAAKPVPTATAAPAAPSAAPAQPRLLNINPNQISFPGNAAETPLNLENISREWLWFKVKTTAPEVYGVRPNKGIVKPGETVTVTVSLKGAVSQDKKKRFKIQAWPVPANTKDEEVAALIPAPPSGSEDLAPFEQKLRCVFADDADTESQDPSASGILTASTTFAPAVSNPQPPPVVATPQPAAPVAPIVLPKTKPPPISGTTPLSTDQLIAERDQLQARIRQLEKQPSLPTPQPQPQLDLRILLIVAIVFFLLGKYVFPSVQS